MSAGGAGRATGRTARPPALAPAPPHPQHGGHRPRDRDPLAPRQRAEAEHRRPQVQRRRQAPARRTGRTAGRAGRGNGSSARSGSSRSRPAGGKSRAGSCSSPSSTCWQLSSTSPVCGSSNDPARPPSVRRASTSVTSAAPLDCSATAAAIPASPPPMTTTRRRRTAIAAPAPTGGAAGSRTVLVGEDGKGEGDCHNRVGGARPMQSPPPHCGSPPRRLRFPHDPRPLARPGDPGGRHVPLLPRATRLATGRVQGHLSGPARRVQAHPAADRGEHSRGRPHVGRTDRRQAMHDRHPVPPGPRRTPRLRPELRHRAARRRAARRQAGGGAGLGRRDAHRQGPQRRRPRHRARLPARLPAHPLVGPRPRGPPRPPSPRTSSTP